jgi:hypothetical protein
MATPVVTKTAWKLREYFSFITLLFCKLSSLSLQLCLLSLAQERLTVLVFR